MPDWTGQGGTPQTGGTQNVNVVNFPVSNVTLKLAPPDVREYKGSQIINIPAGAFEVFIKNIDLITVKVNGQNLTPNGDWVGTDKFNRLNSEQQLLEAIEVDIPENACVRITIIKPQA